jgi:hypothetical protein
MEVQPLHGEKNAAGFLYLYLSLYLHFSPACFPVIITFSVETDVVVISDEQ